MSSKVLNLAEEMQKELQKHDAMLKQVQLSIKDYQKQADIAKAELMIVEGECASRIEQLKQEQATYERHTEAANAQYMQAAAQLKQVKEQKLHTERSLESSLAEIRGEHTKAMRILDEEIAGRRATLRQINDYIAAGKKRFEAF